MIDSFPSMILHARKPRELSQTSRLWINLIYHAYSLFTERGDHFDWEELVDEKTEQLRTVFDEPLSGRNKNLLNSY